MPAQWANEQFCRDLIPYDDIQISDEEFTPSIAKAQGWVTSFLQPVIATTATNLATLPDTAALKMCVALYACYFIVRKKFQGRGPNQNPWVQDLRNDADKLLDQIKNNPSKALGGTTVSQSQVGTMGLQSSKEKYFPTGSLLSETNQFIDPTQLQDEADERNIGLQ